MNDKLESDPHFPYNWLNQLLADNQADAPVDLGKTTGLKVKLK